MIKRPEPKDKGPELRKLVAESIEKKNNGDAVSNYDTFPRKIGYYSLQENVLPLETAIRSATGLPAEILGLKDRGYLFAGLAADITVFDPETLKDEATFGPAPVLIRHPPRLCQRHAVHRRWPRHGSTCRTGVEENGSRQVTRPLV